MEAQKTQAIAEQSVLKAEESLQSNKPQISTLISNLLQRETFIKVFIFISFKKTIKPNLPSKLAFVGLFQKHPK